MKKTLVITVQNESGVLTRICTVFSSRGVNIETLSVGPTENPNFSKLVIVLLGEDQLLEQIIKQLNKFIQVIDVKEMTNVISIERELLLIKLKCVSSLRSTYLELAHIFEAKVVDISEDTLLLEITGDPFTISKFQSLLPTENILEICRTGKVIMERDFLKNVLKD